MSARKTKGTPEPAPRQIRIVLDVANIGHHRMAHEAKITEFRWEVVACVFDYYVQVEADRRREGGDGFGALAGVLSPHTLSRLQRAGNEMPSDFRHRALVATAPSDGRSKSPDDRALVAYAFKHRRDAVQIVSNDLFREFRVEDTREGRWLAAEFDRVLCQYTLHLRLLTLPPLRPFGVLARFVSAHIE